jgi:hypothetical protein
LEINGKTVKKSKWHNNLGQIILLKGLTPISMPQVFPDQQDTLSISRKRLIAKAWRLASQSWPGDGIIVSGRKSSASPQE